MSDRVIGQLSTIVCPSLYKIEVCKAVSLFVLDGINSRLWTISASRNNLEMSYCYCSLDFLQCLRTDVWPNLLLPSFLFSASLYSPTLCFVFFLRVTFLAASDMTKLRLINISTSSFSMSNRNFLPMVACKDSQMAGYFNQSKLNLSLIFFSDSIFK